MAARAEPMAKVRAMVALTLTPMSWAAPLSSDTASMARPDLEYFIKVISPAMMIRQATTVTMVSPEITSLPSISFRAGMVTTEVKDLVFAP